MSEQTQTPLSLDSLFGSGDSSVSQSDASHGLTMDSIFGTAPPVKTGLLADASIAAHSVGKVLDAFGQGAAHGWGSEPFMVNTPIQSALQQNGGWDQYAEKQSAILKGFNEAIIRPSAAVLDTVAGPLTSAGSVITRGAQAVTESAIQGLSQYAQELQKIPVVGPSLAATPGQASDLLGWMADTGAPELMFLHTPHEANLSRARSVGAIGPDGEAGFFDTKPITPEETQSRATAAQEGGETPVTTPVPERSEPTVTKTVQAPPTVHEVARQVYPETFEQYDALAAQKDAAKAELANILPAIREEGPSSQLDYILPEIAQEGEATRLLSQSEESGLDIQEPSERLTEADTLLRGGIDSHIADAQEAYTSTAKQIADLRNTANEAYEAGNRAQSLDLNSQADVLTKEAKSQGARLAYLNEIKASRISENIEGLKSAEPSVPEGHVRLYHGSDGENPRSGWVSPSLEYASNYYDNAHVSYVDVPKDAPYLKRVMEELVPGELDGIDNPVTTQELPLEVAKQLKPLETSKPTRATNSNKAAELINTIVDAENKQRDLIPQIVEANEHATSLMPDPESVPRATVKSETAKPSTPARATGMKSVEGTGDIQARKLSEGIEAKAIENTLTDGFGDLPEYRQLSMADQAEKAQQVVTEDYEAAKDMAMGKKQPPKGVLPESILVAVENRALAEGDIDTLRELATTSRLTTEATTMGQRIRTLGERDPSSPVGAIQSVQEAREADYAKRNAAKGTQSLDDAKATEAQKIKTEMNKTAPNKDAWDNFIKAITCEDE